MTSGSFRILLSHVKSDFSNKKKHSGMISHPRSAHFNSFYGGVSRLVSSSGKFQSLDDLQVMLYASETYDAPLASVIKAK